MRRNRRYAPACRRALVLATDRRNAGGASWRSSAGIADLVERKSVTAIRLRPRGPGAPSISRVRIVGDVPENSASMSPDGSVAAFRLTRRARRQLVNGARDDLPASAARAEKNTCAERTATNAALSRNRHAAGLSPTKPCASALAERRAFRRRFLSAGITRGRRAAGGDGPLISNGPRPPSRCPRRRVAVDEQLPLAGFST